MKTKLLILFFNLFACISIAQINNEMATWDYPVKPGMEEWKSFTTGQQKWEACQIPQRILESLSTKDLAKLCVNFPLFNDYSFFNDERAGINLMVEHFNGLIELGKRKDGVRELIKIYEDFPVLAPNRKVTASDYETLLKLPFLSLLLADDVFIHQLDDKVSAELEKIILEKYERILENIDVYGLYTIRKTFLLAAVVMDHLNKLDDSPKEQENVKIFIENYQHAGPDLLTDISKIIAGL